MSNTRYLEICSDYRNRNLYPYASQFDIEISQSGYKNKFNALDPVSDSAPLLVFNQSFINSDNTYSINITGNVYIYNSTNISNTSANLTLILQSSSSFRPTDFYNGSVLKITTSSGDDIFRRIFKFERLDNNMAIVTLDTPFGDNVTDSHVFEISNPSDNVITDNTRIFIPYGSNADNFYINYYISLYPIECIEFTPPESLKIIAYDGLTHLATLNGNFNNWPTVGLPNINNTFVLRKELPCEQGVLQNTTVSQGLTFNSFLISSNVDYTGDFLRIPSFYSNTLNNPPTENGIRKIVKFQTPLRNIVGIDSTIEIITLKVNSSLNGFSNKTGYYNGLFIRIFSDLGDETKIISNYKITQFPNSFNEYLLIFELNSPISFTPTNANFIILGGILETPFTSPINGNCYELLCFNRDNAVPFNYTGSTISQQEEVCYEIELLDLVLPNRILQTGKGSRITFYPYVYVELSNVSSPGAGQRGILYSNNPNSNKMLFRCPIDDIPNPIISPFIKIDGDGAVQTIKFKINDNLRFSVRLPNGELLITDIPEQYSPLPPNPINQISAYFSLKRL